MTGTMSDDELVRSFEDCTLANSAFHHRDHVRLAWIYLGRHPALEALARFVEGLQRFATFHGHPGLYHETITWAFLFLIHERMADAPGGPGNESWEEFAARNPDLFAWSPSILDRYYDAETLRSERARKVFVLPRREFL
jgi:2'-5' RNA ligase